MIVEARAPDGINDQLIRLAAGDAIERQFGKKVHAASLAKTAAPVKEPFDYPDCIFETKMDGFREFAVIDFDAFASQPSRLSQ